MELYELHHKANLYFLHEHHASTMSWAETEILRIALMPNMTTVVGDQCQYDAQDKESNPIKKPTKFMSNSRHIGEVFSRQCSGRRGLCSRPNGGGSHALCDGARAKAAAIYPFELRRAILTGFRNQMVEDGRLAAGSVLLA